MPDPEPDGGLTLPQYLDELTLRLIGMNEAGQMVPPGGSAFLWRPGDVGPVHLLSVAHTFKQAAHKLVLELGLHARGRGMFSEVPDPGGFHAASIRLNGGDDAAAEAEISDAQKVDFAWVTYPPEMIDRWTEEIAAKRLDGAASIYGGQFAEPLHGDARYHFAAKKVWELHPPTGVFEWKRMAAFGMTFDGVEAAGQRVGLYRFHTAETIPPEGFRGSSGAPIVDDDGIPVAMVAAGISDGNVIYGCPLLPYTRYLTL